MAIDAFRNKTFNNILITPTVRISTWGKAKVSLLSGKIQIFAGGPSYGKKNPRFVRHCIGPFPIVFDEDGKPALPVDRIAQGVWCGHVYKHFGHMIADFSMRIAVSASENPDKYLLFALEADADPSSVPKFFWEILPILGAKKENVRLINKPTLVNELIVYAQAERRYLGKPSRPYLQLLDSLHPPSKKIYPAIYFSRGNFSKGIIAGEHYLEEVMRQIGVLVIRPEDHPLAEQVEFCRCAEKLLFSEGSAVHLLQLAGTGIGDVIVLNRRPHYSFFCWTVISSRAKSVNYINAIADFVYCLPERVTSYGITTLNANHRFFKLFKKQGLDIKNVWNTQAFEACVTQDIIKWIDLLPMTIWANRRFSKKCRGLKKAWPEINHLLTVKQEIYPQWEHFKKLVIFDELFYLNRNPDVANASADALDHYLRHGWKENRDPSPYFNMSFYMSQFTGGYPYRFDPLFHYLSEGWKAGINPSPQFNVRAYLNRYQDVKRNNWETLQHYIGEGQFLGYITN